jgi:Arc/MetJ-type ribon-helix-helix transcriptional regulator
MSNLTVTISKKLARLIQERQKKAGFPTLDETAAALIADGLLVRRLDEDHSGGLDDWALRKLIDDGEASGPVEPWDAASVRAEVRRRYAVGKKKKK